MKAHTVTTEFDRSGELLLEHTRKRYGVVCWLDAFAARWSLEPSIRERDLAHIAAAIYAADRIVKRPGRAAEPVRYIKLKIPVIDPDSANFSLVERLSTLAGFLSGDEWDLQLCPTDSRLESPFQQHLGLEQPQKPRLCLYSNGLDSAAGLAIRRNESTESWVAVTVGHQSGIRHQTMEQIKAHRRYSARPLQHVQLVAGLRRPPPVQAQEKTQRTRGILFCVAAGLAAKWSGAGKVEVFENGVGAFNLPLMTGMLSGGRATRGAHPRFLSEIGPIIELVVDHPVRFSLPFWADTKAEMLRRLPFEQARELVDLSHSCVHTSIRERGKDHCGVCPACIERQITLHAAGLTDRPSRYQQIIEPSNNDMPTKARQYISFRRRRAAGAIKGSEDFRTLQSDYMRLCGLKLLRRRHRAFERLMQRDGRECLTWFFRGRRRHAMNEEVVHYGY